MAKCTQCDREYLDSYQVCPFCEREQRAAREALLPSTRPEKSRRISPAIIAVITALASLSGIIVYVALQLFFGSMVVDTADSAGGREACFMNQGIIERAVLVRYAETENPVRDLDVLFPEYVQSFPVCPEEGTYTYSWSPQRPKLQCSVHGWHGE